MRGFSPKKLSILFILLLSSFQSAAQGLSDYNVYLSHRNRLLFGDYLFCGEDYLRAIYEYREALTSVASDTVQFKIAYAFSKMGRYSEASDNFKSLFFNFNLAEEAKFEYFKIQFLTLTPEEFRAELLASPFKSNRYSGNLAKLEMFSHLLDNSLLPDSAAVVNRFEQDRSDEVYQLFKRKKFPEHRDPLTAAILSAVLPGAGKIYTEQYGDAITAFLFTGLLTYSAVSNYNAGHKTRVWTLGTLAALFYAGNVYGAYSSAQIFNAKVRFDFEQDVLKFLQKADYFSPIYDFLCGDKK